MKNKFKILSLLIVCVLVSFQLYTFFALEHELEYTYESEPKDEKYTNGYDYISMLSTEVCFPGFIKYYGISTPNNVVLTVEEYINSGYSTREEVITYFKKAIALGFLLEEDVIATWRDFYYYAQYAIEDEDKYYREFVVYLDDIYNADKQLLEIPSYVEVNVIKYDRLYKGTLIWTNVVTFYNRIKRVDVRRHGNIITSYRGNLYFVAYIDEFPEIELEEISNYAIFSKETSFMPFSNSPTHEEIRVSSSPLTIREALDFIETYY